MSLLTGVVAAIAQAPQCCTTTPGQAPYSVGGQCYNYGYGQGGVYYSGSLCTEPSGGVQAQEQSAASGYTSCLPVGEMTYYNFVPENPTDSCPVSVTAASISGNAAGLGCTTSGVYMNLITYGDSGTCPSG